MQRLMVLFSLLAGSCLLPLHARHLPRGEISAAGNFNSEYVDRGRKWGANDCTFGLQTSYECFGGHVDLGSIDRLALTDSEILLGERSHRFSMSQTSPMIAFRHVINRRLWLHSGYIAKFFTNLKPLTAHFSEHNGLGILRNSHEFYLALSGENKIPWKFAAHYDFSREEILAKASLTYAHDLRPYDVGHFSLATAIGVGFDRAQKPWGIRHYFNQSGLQNSGKSYGFWDLQLALIYRYSADYSMNMALNYAGNGASKLQWANCLFGHHRQMCWMSLGAHCCF